MILSTWAENENSESPSVDDISAWAEKYGMTFPVLADPSWAINNRFEKDQGIPTQVLLAPGAKLVKVDAMITSADIEAVLEGEE
jgi:hypothetical protein